MKCRNKGEINGVCLHFVYFLNAGIGIDWGRDGSQFLTKRFTTAPHRRYLMVQCAADTEQPNFFAQFITPSKSNVSVTLGPIVGEVSDSAAKVLLEVNGKVKVRCLAQKLHNRSLFAYDEMEDLAMMQFKLEEMKKRIQFQEDFEVDSDPVIIADCRKEIDSLTGKIKVLADKLNRVKTVVRTISCEANVPAVFSFEEGSLESGSKYWISFEPFADITCSFVTLPARSSSLSICCVSGMGKFGGLLHACTPASYETWKGILGGSSGGGGRKFERIKVASLAATSYNKFGESFNTPLEDDEVIPIFSDNPNLDYENEMPASVPEQTPRMLRGWYGGASGVGMGGERGLGAGANVMFLLDKCMSSPKRAYDIMIQIGGCGVTELFSLLNKDKFLSCLAVATGLSKATGAGGPRSRTKLAGLRSTGRGRGRGGTPSGRIGQGRDKQQAAVKGRESAAQEVPKNDAQQGSSASVDSNNNNLGESGSGFGDFGDIRIRTIEDDAFLDFSDDEDEVPAITHTAMEQLEIHEGDGNFESDSQAAMTVTRKKKPKGESFEYWRPRGGKHVAGSGGTLGNEESLDDNSLLVRESDISVWPPEVGEGAAGGEGASTMYGVAGGEVDEFGYTKAMRWAENECLDMLKNAYRVLFSLPLYSNVMGSVARLSLFSPDDLHNGLEQLLGLLGHQERLQVGDGAVAAEEHPLAGKRLRKLSVKAWQIYCGSLRIEPVRERVIAQEEDAEEGADVSLSEAIKRKQKRATDMLKPVHQARVLSAGTTSILMVDVKSNR